MTKIITTLMSTSCCISQAGIKDAQTHENAKDILLKMGEFFQIQVKDMYYEVKVMQFTFKNNVNTVIKRLVLCLAIIKL